MNRCYVYIVVYDAARLKVWDSLELPKLTFPLCLLSFNTVTLH